MKVIMYSLPTCGKCNTLGLKLQAAGIEYEKVQDIDVMQKLKIMQTPMLDIGDKKLLSFFEAIEWIKTQK
jgi:glutaredoxin